MATPDWMHLHGRTARSRWTLAAGSLVLLAAGAVVLEERARVRRPDVVVIVWDTGRGDRTGVAGYPRPTTPSLDAFALRATVFRNCVTPSPWSPPAHASLFTGLLPSHHGLREGRGDRVRAGIPRLAETLARAGYETVGISANPEVSPLTGLDAGFSTFRTTWRSDESKGSGAAVRAELRALLERRRAAGSSARPLFLFVNLMETHIPYTFEAGAVAAVRGDAAVNAARAAAAGVGPVESNAHNLGGARVPPEILEGLDAAYDGAMRLADRECGGILEDLDRAGVLAGAFTAITSDHGENLGEHGLLGHQYNVFATVLRVPLVVRWPGRLGEGVVEDAQVRLQDLHPTILEAAGVPVPRGTGADAESLGRRPLEPRVAIAQYGPVLDNEDRIRAGYPARPHEAFERIHLEFLAVREPPTRPGARTYVRTVRHEIPWDEGVAQEELFDPVSDPGEERNLLVPGAPAAEREAADRLRERGLEDAR